MKVKIRKMWTQHSEKPDGSLGTIRSALDKLFAEAGLKRAISRSDVLYKEIYDRLEGKAPQELRFAGYAEPYSEERMIETRSEIYRKLMDFLARGDPQEDSAQSEPVKALPERT